MRMHDNFYLPWRQVKQYTARPEAKEDATYSVSITEDGIEIAMIPNLNRTQVLIHLAMMGRLNFYDTIDGVLKAAEEIASQVQVDDNTKWETIFGCQFEIFFHDNGVWSLELEPGMGTTVCAMTFDTCAGALEALMGLLFMLKGDQPYLKRTS